MTTVLPLWGIVGDHTAAFSGSGEPSLASLWPCRPPEWRDSRIIQDKIGGCHADGGCLRSGETW